MALYDAAIPPFNMISQDCSGCTHPRHHWTVNDRCNVTDMMDGLPCIIAVLLDNDQSLLALPVIALLEWLAQHVWADPVATVAVRLQRAAALTHLGLLAEAAVVLGALVQVWCTYPHPSINSMLSGTAG